MQEPTPFRSLEEVKKYLAEQLQQFRDDKQMVDKSMHQLARISVKAALPGVKIMDFSGDGGVKKGTKRTLNVNFPVVKVPDAEQLQKSYKMAERMSEQYKALLLNENNLKMNFKNATNKNFEAMMGSFTKLKTDMEETMRKLFSMLHEVAQKHAPKEYLTFVETIAKELESNDHVECESLDTLTYVALDKEGKLIFAGYIILKNAVSDEGRIAPHIYITIKWTVGGDVEIFVEHEFIAPTLLDSGIVVSNLHQAGKAITHQLTLEGFSSQIGSLPVALQMKEPVGGLRREAFSAAPYIQGIHAEKHELCFVLKDVNKTQRDEIKSQLFQEVRALLNKKRGTKIRMRDEGPNVIFTFADIDHSDGITPNDLEFLADRYHLTDTQLRKIVNNING